MQADAGYQKVIAVIQNPSAQPLNDLVSLPMLPSFETDDLEIWNSEKGIFERSQAYKVFNNSFL
jgi:hypothetical protein